MVGIIIQSSKTDNANEKAKRISELLYTADDSIIKELISYKNDLLLLDDVLKRA